MSSRLELHEELCAIPGIKKVYFQSPASVKMEYPCIRYSKSNVNINRANDRIYKSVDRYEVTVIDPDPDSDIYNEILNRFSMCSFDRAYPAENLNHFVLTLYY